MVFAQLQEPALRPRTDQELVELRHPVAIHAAVAMARAEIALVKREMLIGAIGREDPRVDVGIARQAAALSAIRQEVIDRNPHGDAGAATMAVRPIDDVARPPESPAQRHRIQPRQARIARIEHEVARIALGPVTAGMIAGVEQAQLADGLVLLERIAAHAASIAPAAQGDESTSLAGESLTVRF